jgi:hypothetical protein
MLHSSTLVLQGSSARFAVPKLLIAIRHSLYPRQNRPQPQDFSHCTFHHSGVDNFMATFIGIKLPFAKPLV